MTGEVGHVQCERIRMALAEAGLDPARMMCSDDGRCTVAAGVGEEGLPVEVVDRLTDQAIAITRTWHKWPPAAHDG